MGDSAPTEPKRDLLWCIYLVRAVGPIEMDRLVTN